MIEDWALEKLNPLRNERLVIVHDPQRMIHRGAAVVDGWAVQNGFTVIFPSGNLGFRDQFEQIRDNAELKIVLVDRSREDRGLPLFYPDLQCRSSSRARLKLTLRDLLAERTGDDRWPKEVNDRNLSRLVLANLEGTLHAYQQLRDANPQRFTDSDLYKIVLGATLGINPFKNLTPQEIRSLCIERHQRLEEVRNLFAASGASEEAQAVLESLKTQVAAAERPWCWMLDHDPQDVVRAFTLACILNQHGVEYEVLLGNFDPGLGRYQDIPHEVVANTTKQLLQADPDGLADDVAKIEQFLIEEPQKRLAFLLANRCQIDQPAEARKVLLAEKLSPLVRSLALVSLLADLISGQNLGFHRGVLAAIDKEGTASPDELPLAARRPTPQWTDLLTAYRRAICYFEIAAKLHDHAKRLKVAKTDQLEFPWFYDLWTKDRVDRLDYYGTDLQRLLRVGNLLPLALNEFWPALVQRWQQVETRLNEAIANVQKSMNLVNEKFQDLYRLHYTTWIKRTDSPVKFTHQFVPLVLKTHWDADAGERAVILVFDGLRTDAWEEFVKPVLEEKYDFLKTIPASAILPSETHISRKAISAGCLPCEFASTTESKLLEYGLITHMGLNIKLKVERDQQDLESGITARYVSDQLEMVIFNFTDKNLHSTHQDMAFIYANTVRAIVQQDVRSVLRDLPKDAKVFVVADHGFTPLPVDTFVVPQDRLTDAGDVKYRVGRLKYPLEGADAKKGVSFKVEDMGIPDRINQSNGASWAFKHVLFPRPGLTLKRPSGRHDPERYTHGGLSMAECLIPMFVLGPKKISEPAFEFVELTVEGSPVEGETLDIMVKARSKQLFVEDLLFRLDTNLEEIQLRTEIFSGQTQTYRIRWKPKTDNILPEEQKQGKLVRDITVVGSYLWHDRPMKTSIHTTIEITLDTSRIRRRLDNRLDSIMGMVPKELR
ncbi:MAG: PglZ domain-containing protein [Planctomycetota bacterium]